MTNEETSDERQRFVKNFVSIAYDLSLETGQGNIEEWLKVRELTTDKLKRTFPGIICNKKIINKGKLQPNKEGGAKK